MLDMQRLVLLESHGMLRSHQIATRPEKRVVYAMQQYLMLSMPLLHFMSQAFYVQTDILIVYDSIDIARIHAK